MKVDGRGLAVGAETLGAPHVFSAENVAVGQSVLVVNDLRRFVCSFPEYTSLDLACGTLLCS